jgi:hypothetical protein
MMSHDLARELLKRRNNDIRFLLELDQKGKDTYNIHIRMRDDSEEPDCVISPQEAINYYPPGNYILVELDILELGYGGD